MIKSRISLIVVLAVMTTTVTAQRWGRRQLADTRYDRGGVPEWEMNQEFPTDVFTFARVKFTSYGRWGWPTDYPDSDLNFSYRLQELTSLRTHPYGKVVELTDEDISDYPFLYMIEPGHIQLSEAEVLALRNYLDRGGFMMVDDFWGGEEYENFHLQMSRVFPDQEPVELPLDHALFSCVYKLTEKPQVPSVNHALNGRTYEHRSHYKDDGSQVHYRAYLDEQDRIKVIICHNTDLGDGWEREGVNEWYFHEYSEKRAYPMGINIIFYAMTH